MDCGVKSIQEFALSATTTGLMTFAEFEQLPEAPGHRYELRHGELTRVPPAKLEHCAVQVKLRAILESAAGHAGQVIMEFGFRPTREWEFRIADVAFISWDRWNASDFEDYFQGAPDIVIEVLSRSNTATEMLDKEQLCLENGAREFWVVDPARNQVRVSTAEGRTQTWRAGQTIPLYFGGSIAVDSIFN